jgi:NADH-quinone oxidoreductase subunit F
MPVRALIKHYRHEFEAMIQKNTSQAAKSGGSVQATGRAAAQA